MSCLVLSCLVSTRVVFSDNALVLSYLVLSCPVLVLSCLDLPGQRIRLTLNWLCSSLCLFLPVCLSACLCVLLSSVCRPVPVCLSVCLCLPVSLLMDFAKGFESVFTASPMIWKREGYMAAEKRMLYSNPHETDIDKARQLKSKPYNTRQDTTQDNKHRQDNTT